MTPKAKTEMVIRVAHEYMRKEAAFREWLQWVSQPFDTIIKLHKEFVLGPVQDLVDEIIKRLVPGLVKELAKVEIEKDVTQYEFGFLRGRDDGRKKLPYSIHDHRNESEEFQEGYEFGWRNWQLDKLPPSVKKEVIEDSLDDFREEVTPKVVTTLLKKAWHALNPLETVKAMIVAVKKHGWKLGVGFALFEVFEHFVVPTMLTYLFDDPRLMTLATLPIGEVVYAVALRFLGKTPKELDKAKPQGNVELYEEQFGPLKIACLSRTVR